MSAVPTASMVYSEPTDVYHVGPGDILEVRIDRLLEPEKEAILVQAVDPRGRVYLPLLHHVAVAGKTCEQVRNDLVLRLGQEFLRDPRVDVAVKEYGSKRVVVLGAVGQPGTVALRSDVTTLMDVISDVGGITSNAAPMIEILRGAYTIGEEPRLEQAAWQGEVGPTGRRELVPVARLFSQGSDQVNPPIYAGDVVQVPEGSEGYVYVAGEVQKPGGLQFRRPLGLLQAIACAGGVTRVAKEGECRLIRRTPEGREEVYQIDLSRIRSGEEANIQLAMNDTIVLPTDPVKKFFVDVDNFVRRGVFAGVELTYDAGSQMGWPQGGGY
jgi:polysaccharide export outer membrane protein